MLLDQQLGDHRSADKTQTLLHFIAQTLLDHHPDAISFPDELVRLDKAALISLATLQADVRGYRSALLAATAELSTQPANKALHEYVILFEPLVAEAGRASDDAVRMFHKTAKFFCEDEKSDPASFFAIFMRFGTDLHRAVKENKARARKVFFVCVCVCVFPFFMCTTHV